MNRAEEPQRAHPGGADANGGGSTGLPTEAGLVEQSSMSGLVESSSAGGLVERPSTDGLVEPLSTDGLVAPSSTDGLVEPVSDVSDRRLRRALSRQDPSTPWFRIALMVLGLVALLSFHGALGEKATGCFHKVAQVQAPASAPEAAEPAKPPASPPEIQIRRIRRER